MNPHPTGDPSSLQLVDIIDFKWLMSHVGHHVHVERLQSDPAYALELLDLAAGSQSEALRGAASRLREKLGGQNDPPPAPGAGPVGLRPLRR